MFESIFLSSEIAPNKGIGLRLRNPEQHPSDSIHTYIDEWGQFSECLAGNSDSLGGL
jgi:hypothetical protein